jgi:DNA-binding transcriptional regulator YiaG
MGRPSKYKPEYCQKLIKFFDVEPYEEREIPHYKGKGENKTVSWTDYKRMANKLPTLRNFAKKIKVAVATVYNWADESHGSFHKEFLDAFICAQDLRKWFLVENGLNGCYNPLFAKFVAINVTDMKDKQEIDHNDITTPNPLTEEDIEDLRQKAGKVIKLKKLG